MKQNFIIENLQTEADIFSAFPLMKQLRPHLTSKDYLQKVQLQMSIAHWQLAALKFENKIICLAGYRISSSLAWGKFLYVDDLVTDEKQRSQSYGQHLLAWLKAEAERQGCDELHLDSGLERVQAHAFYRREKLKEVGLHFRWKGRE